MAINEMDARLISQAEQISELSETDLVSVSRGEGQPSLNIKFGDLVKAVAAVIGTANFSKNGLMPSNQYLSKSEVFANEEITSLEQIKDGMTFYFGAGTSVMPSPNGSVLKFSGSNCETYFASNENASNLFQRTIREGNDSGWQRIDNFGYNTLAELASGVAEVMKSKGMIPVDVGSQDATYWNNICDAKYAGRIVTGYHTGLNSGIVAIGNSTYTLQIANEYLGEVVKIRTYYSDGSYWTSWKTISFS